MKTTKTGQNSLRSRYTVVSNILGGGGGGAQRKLGQTLKSRGAMTFHTLNTL